MQREFAANVYARVFKTVCDAYDWRAEGKPQGDFRQAKAACLRCTMRHVWCVYIYTHTRAHAQVFLLPKHKYGLCGIRDRHTFLW